MKQTGYYIAIFSMSLLLLMLSCSTSHRVQSNLPKPGKQCNILVTNKYKPKKAKKTKVKEDRVTKTTPMNYQASLMTDEQYMEQVRKVQKSLPKFDIEKDCPEGIKKHSKKKSFFKKLFNKTP